MKKIMQKLQELEIELYLADIEDDAHYLPDCKIIFANMYLKEKDLIAAILHEIKHIISHTEFVVLYKDSFSYRSKMEREADIFMLDEMIAQSEGYFNFSALIEEFQLDMGMEELLKLRKAQ